MTLGLSADQVVAGTAVVTLVGGGIVTLAGYILHQKDEAQSREMKRIEDGGKEKHVLLDASIKAAWMAIDKLKDERGHYWTREDGERMRLEFKADIEKLGDRMIGEIARVSKQLSEDLNRALGSGDRSKGV